MQPQSHVQSPSNDARNILQPAPRDLAMSAARLTIFARWPEPGRAKTRLIPALGAEGAAALYRRLLEHTLAEARASGLPIELRVTGAEPARFQDWLGGDLAVVDQGEGDLGARMARVAAPAILIGSDCPDCDAAMLRRATIALARAPAVVGPASDGGYYLLGMGRPMPFLFHDMAWSTDAVMPETLRRFALQGIAPALLPELGDIDTPDDLARYPQFAR